MAASGTSSLIFIDAITHGSSRMDSEVYGHIVDKLQRNTSKQIGRNTLQMSQLEL